MDHLTGRCQVLLSETLKPKGSHLEGWVRAIDVALADVGVGLARHLHRVDESAQVLRSATLLDADAACRMDMPGGHVSEHVSTDMPGEHVRKGPAQLGKQERTCMAPLHSSYTTASTSGECSARLFCAAMIRQISVGVTKHAGLRMMAQDMKAGLQMSAAIAHSYCFCSRWRQRRLQEPGCFMQVLKLPCMKQLSCSIHKKVELHIDEHGVHTLTDCT